MKILAAGLLACSLLLPPRPASALTDEGGTIGTVYVSSTGNLAFTLVNGFPLSVSRGECPTANSNGYAGMYAVSKELLAAVLLAKAMKTPVTITVSGCTAGGAWYNATAIYIY